jgi:hypothetical protein
MVTSHDEAPMSGQPAQMTAEQMKRLQEQGYFELEGLVMEQMLKTKYVLQDLDKNYKVGLECRDRIVVIERQQREQQTAVEAYAKSSEQLAVTTSQSFVAASNSFGGLRDDVMGAVGGILGELGDVKKKLAELTPVDKRHISLRAKRTKADWAKIAAAGVTALTILGAAASKFVDLLAHWFGGPH